MLTNGAVTVISLSNRDCIRAAISHDGSSLCAMLQANAPDRQPSAELSAQPSAQPSAKVLALTGFQHAPTLLTLRASVLWFLNKWRQDVAQDQKLKTIRSAAIGFLLVVGATLLGLGIYFGAASNSGEASVGRDYELIETGQAESNRSKPRFGPIEVTEFFSYGCVHCRNFEPLLEEWLEELPEGVRFRRSPAAFSPTWLTLSQAYFALESKRLLNPYHARMFSAVHDRGMRFSNGAEVAEYLADSRVSAEEWERALNDPQVRRKLSLAENESRQFGIRAVPTLVVAGKYRISMDNGMQRALEVASQLITKELNSRTPTDQSAAGG